MHPWNANGAWALRVGGSGRPSCRGTRRRRRCPRSRGCSSCRSIARSSSCSNRRESRSGYAIYAISAWRAHGVESSLRGPRSLSGRRGGVTAREGCNRLHPWRVNGTVSKKSVATGQEAGVQLIAPVRATRRACVRPRSVEVGCNRLRCSPDRHSPPRPRLVSFVCWRSDRCALSPHAR